MRGLSLFLTLTVLCATAAAEPWTPDFARPEGVRHFLLALENEEPGMVERSSWLGTNLVEVAQTVPEVLGRLGEHAVSLVIEENYTTMPAAFALFRNVYSIERPLDASAYYALVQRTHTFVFERQGAAFVVEVEHLGRTIPYVLTIEGPGMTEAATERALYAVASYFRSDVVALPEIANAYSFTDNDLARRVFGAVESNEVELALPEGWAKVDAWLAERGERETYFRETSLRQARLVTVPEAFRSSPDVETRPERNFPSTPSRARVLLASQAAWRGWEPEDAARAFRVPSENLLAASTVCRSTTQAADEGP